MISVIFNWIYITVICFTFGFAFAQFIEKKQDYQIRKMTSFIAVGLILMTVYAQVYSIFSNVGLWANLILLFGMCFIVIIYRKKFFSYLQETWRSTSSLRKVMILVLIMFFAAFTSKGIMHYDSDLYHAQSIRWIEEYGVVSGLANLHNRFGYNSASFALSALFSMKWLIGRSLHTMSGYFAIVLCVSTLDIAKSFPNKKFRISDYARIAALFYLSTICAEIVAPASDYPIMCTVFYIMIQWLSLLEEDKEKSSSSAVPYALLCMGGAFGLTLKVTAGFILLLAVKPIVEFIKQRKYKEIIFYVCFAVIIILPWIIRNVIITGYLLYPFPAIDLFKVDYKLDAAEARYDANEIKVYGRGLYDVACAGDSVLKWGHYWFKSTLSNMQKLFILSDCLCIIGIVVDTILVFVKKKWERLNLLLVFWVLIGSFFFWFEGAPLVRYGYAYVLLMAAVPIGAILDAMDLKKIIYYPVLLFGVWKIIMLIQYGCQVVPYMDVMWQQEYGKYEMNSFSVENIEIFYPVEGDRHGYEYFPSTNRRVNITLRGESIKNGFRRVD